MIYSEYLYGSIRLWKCGQEEENAIGPDTAGATHILIHLDDILTPSIIITPCKLKSRKDF